MATRLIWQGPTTYTDGSAFGEADLAGYQVSIDGQPAVNIPTAWNPDNEYEITFAELGLSYGPHTATVATVAQNGRVSEPTPVLNFNYEDLRVPNPPISLAAV